MVALAQLHAADFPEIAFPDDTDLVQVLWCPNDHRDTAFCVEVVWRRAAEVTDVLTDPPMPSMSDDGYLPAACVIHPERVREYPWYDDLPADLQTLLDQWDGYPEYQYLLSVAPGWKVGGSRAFNVTDGTPRPCDTCDSPVTLLLQVDTGEWSHESAPRWQPLEEHELHLRNATCGDPCMPTGVVVNDYSHMGIYTCTTNPRHSQWETQ